VTTAGAFGEPLRIVLDGMTFLAPESLVKELDLDGIYAHYERDLRGFPPYHPQMMVGLLIYAYCVGGPSSRKIERKTYEHVAFRVIAGEVHPDHSRINEFRRAHLEALAGLFVQVLRLCQQAGLVKLGKVALEEVREASDACCCVGSTKSATNGA
jgi:transposase